ncbi:hypothetical protein SCLCIDRAFT_769103 [Scleroderma citrinum Foug A]|uniref:Uncharacterized protein n=1 Tax=Scleroderma citrinum Foug A TaxID=1036808 RepID=A0A0C3E3V9_9AGAM|nr:hypothetical protein SCLCIDRAFT_769103 [Scleroderma citrinum Foug A]
MPLPLPWSTRHLRPRQIHPRTKRYFNQYQREMTMSPTGATILKSIHLDNAAIKIFVNIPEVQNDEIHHQTIVDGYRIASTAALEALEKAAVNRAYICPVQRGSAKICSTFPLTRLYKTRNYWQWMPASLQGIGSLERIQIIIHLNQFWVTSLTNQSWSTPQNA